MSSNPRFTPARRALLRKFCAAGAGLLLAPYGLDHGQEARAAETFPAGRWPLGCFNRPWGRWSYDDALDGIKAAGFQYTGILGDHAGEPFTLPEATDVYLDRLRERIEARGLKTNVAWLRTRHDIAREDAIKSARRQVDNAARLGVTFLLTGGVDPPGQFDHFFDVMREAARYAADQKMLVVLKPHGGCSATAADMLRAIEKVDRPNFRLWYDAGNIIHYTGLDPVTELKKLGDLVAGFSAKDCRERGGDVMLRFGDGRVDFKAVFAALAESKFAGPMMVECCDGNTKADVILGARANGDYVRRLIPAAESR
jgi:sugar phosphate isomerase/epimerase